MIHSRNVVIVILLCAAFVSLAAMLRASDLPYERLSAATGDIDETEASKVDDAPLATDRQFFSTSTNEMVERTARSLPQALSTEVAPSTARKVYADGITAEAYLVGDISTGQIYIEKNAGAVLPFASMSKLITAIAATDRYELTDVVAISSSSADVWPDASMLRVGERFAVGELLEAMLMSSSNVAAEAMASAIGERSAFLELMSGYAWEIGMPSAFFADPTGLSPRNAGTAWGFFEMARYLYIKRPDILAITRKPESTVATTTDHDAHRFVSTHPFVADPRFRGGKTGRTPEALETMLTIMEISGRPIAIIVLRSDWARAEDTRLLIERVSTLLH